MKGNWRSFLVAFISTLAIVLSFSQYLSDPAISEPRTYKFGIPPWQKGQDVDDIHSRYKPMLDLFAKMIEHRFVIVGSNDYEELSEFIADGKVQLASISPAPFILAQKKLPGIKMLVTDLSWNPAMTQKRDFYQSNIVCLKKRKDIFTILDLKGKVLDLSIKDPLVAFKYRMLCSKPKGLTTKNFSVKYFLG